MIMESLEKIRKQQEHILESIESKKSKNTKDSQSFSQTQFILNQQNQGIISLEVPRNIYQNYDFKDIKIKQQKNNIVLIDLGEEQSQQSQDITFRQQQSYSNRQKLENALQNLKKIKNNQICKKNSEILSCYPSDKTGEAVFSIKCYFQTTKKEKIINKNKNQQEEEQKYYIQQIPVSQLRKYQGGKDMIIDFLLSKLKWKLVEKSLSQCDSNNKKGLQMNNLKRKNEKCLIDIESLDQQSAEQQLQNKKIKINEIQNNHNILKDIENQFYTKYQAFAQQQNKFEKKNYYQSNFNQNEAITIYSHQNKTDNSIKFTQIQNQCKQKSSQDQDEITIYSFISYNYSCNNENIDYDEIIKEIRKKNREIVRQNQNKIIFKEDDQEVSFEQFQPVIIKDLKFTNFNDATLLELRSQYNKQFQERIFGIINFHNNNIQ